MCLRDQGEPPDTHPAGLEDDDAALVKIALDRHEIGEQTIRLLLGPSLRAVAKQHDRGRSLSAQGEQCPEVSVRGHNHTLLLLCAIEYLLVAGRPQSIVANVYSVVSGSF